MTCGPAPQEPQSPEASRHHAGDGLVVDSEVCWVHCGYALRGLSRRQRCPECGTAVLFSTAGDLLTMAPTWWLARARSGLGLMVWAVGLDLAAWPAWCGSALTLMYRYHQVLRWTVDEAEVQRRTGAMPRIHGRRND